MINRSAALIAAILIGGCSSGGGEIQMPAHYPAKGQITQHGKPVGAGFVRFNPTTSEDFLVNGEVDISGKFELITSVKDKRMKGAPTGTYTVTFTPKNPDQNGKPVATKNTYVIEAKENDLSIELDEK